MLRVGRGRSAFGPAAVSGGSAPAVTCSYALNATAGELAGMGFAGKLVMDATEQIGTRTLVAHGGDMQLYGAAPTGIASGAKLALNTGKKVVQVRLTVPALSGGAAADAAWSYVEFLTSGFAQRLGIHLRTLNDGTRSLTVFTANVSRYSASGVGTSVLITCYFDAGASALAVEADGVPLVLTNNAYTPAELMAVEQVRDYGLVNGGDCIVELITSRADMTGSITSGYTDVCGN